MNKSFISHIEDVLADDSAPESEYDSKSLKRKKKQNKIRRWAMDKLVKRGSAKESGKETPTEGDDISITSRDVASARTLPLSVASARTLPLRERKSTFSVGDLPPPKPPRAKKVKSVAMETSVMEPLLSTEDPMSEEWYKSGTLFEAEDFCDSIMEVIKNIGYTCDSPASSMMHSDSPVPADNQNEVNENNQCEEEVIANGNVLECDSSMNKTLTPLTIKTQDLTDGDQASDRIYEEIPDEFQRYNGDDKMSTESLHDEASVSVATTVNTRGLREKSVSASDVSLEFFSAHSSPIGTLDNCGSPVTENSEPPTTATRKPAKKQETTAWMSEDSSSGCNSGTNLLLQESPPVSKASTMKISPDTSNNNANFVTQTSIPNSVSIEISEAGGVTKDSEPSITPGESDTGPAYTTIKSNMDNDCSSSTLVVGNATEENPEVTSSNPEITSSPAEVTSSVASASSLKVSSGNPSPVISALALPEAGDPFTSDDELEDNGRPSSTIEPIIIPLSKSAHEVGSLNSSSHVYYVSIG